MSTVESIARPRRNGERRRAPTASISKESPAITGVVEMVIDDQSDQQGSQDGKGHAAYARRQSFPISAFLLNRSSDLDRKSGSAGMPRPISYAVFCLKKKDSMPNSTGLRPEGRCLTRDYTPA